MVALSAAALLVAAAASAQEVHVVTSGGFTEAYKQLAPRFDRLFEERSGEIAVTPERNLQQSFERVSGEVKRYLQDGGRLAFLVDEMRFLDTEASTAEDFNYVLRCTERSSSTIILTAHRPADISTHLRSIVDVWCLFYTTQEHDLEVIAERCSDRVADRVSKLKPRQFVVWDDTKTDHQDREVLTPDAWYVPLKKATTGGPAPETLPGLGQPIARVESDKKLF
jgi:hypothetical protein